MLSLLVSLLILILVLAVFWWAINLVPVPADSKWIVQLLFAVVAIIIVLSLLMGAWQFPVFHAIR